MQNILVIYYYAGPEYPPRNSSLDHLYALERYAEARCFYVNIAVRRVPRYIWRIPFDLIVFHTSFLASRWNPLKFRRLIRKISVVKDLPGVKIALPQDEFIYTTLLCDFINEFRIDNIFSVASPSEWPKIYAQVDRDRVSIDRILTAYLDGATIDRIRLLEARTGRRTVDIGYRAWRPAPWLGRHALLKRRVAEVFQQRAPAEGFSTNISTAEGDTLLGDAWYEFLVSCRYTIGVEAGASILDSDGSIKRRTEIYMARNPRASFAEIERQCFSDHEGSLQLRTLGPRNLEAAAAKTCQILVDGDYNGVLVPDEHYIALRPDFSNIDEVLASLKCEDRRQAMVDKVYADIVASGRYTYRRFVEVLLNRVPAGGAPRVRGGTSINALHGRARVADRRSWRAVAVIAPARGALRRAAVGILSEARAKAAINWIRDVGRR